MTAPTTYYGSWHNAVGGQTLGGPAGYVLDCLDTYGPDDFDVDGLTDAFIDAVRERLPEGVTLAGDQILAPANYPGEPLIDVCAAVDTIDFWALAEQYDYQRDYPDKEST